MIIYFREGGGGEPLTKFGNSQTKGLKDTEEQHLYKDQNKFIF